MLKVGHFLYNVQEHSKKSLVVRTIPVWNQNTDCVKETVFLVQASWSFVTKKKILGTTEKVLWVWEVMSWPSSRKTAIPGMVATTIPRPNTQFLSTMDTKMLRTTKIGRLLQLMCGILARTTLWVYLNCISSLWQQTFRQLLAKKFRWDVWWEWKLPQG